MVNYPHQAPMKRLGKLPEKRGKEAKVASLGRSRFHFKFPIRCRTAVAVTKTVMIFMEMLNTMARMLMFREKASPFFVKIKR